MSKYNWTRQETKDLITLYEINECLWNKNLREYKDRDERVSSIQSISDEMKISIEEINKKIHNLRNQYRFELNKMKKNIPGKPKYETFFCLLHKF
jgi:predicted patatin/cPLA2 family phospholipase